MDKYSLDHIKLQEELLQLLCVNHEGDDLESKIKLFDMRRNEVKMMPHEKLNLFQKAILIQPNNTYIISQLGLALSALGEDDLAKALYENAVERGLWPNVLQRPEFTFVPGLLSKPWHDIQDFPFMIKLMEHYDVIRDELLYNLAERSYVFNNEQENVNVVTGGDWKALQIKTSPGFNYGYTKYAEYFPRTVKILQECNEDFLLVKFSAIKPGTHIEPHTGPSNERLRSHLTLIHTGGARIRVGSEWRTWKEGEGMILDSSWEHEVLHEGRDIRVILILDIWHPDYQP
jgi:aspartate beta-hydroxylase